MIPAPKHPQSKPSKAVTPDALNLHPASRLTKTSHHRSHKRLHSHHQSMPYFAAAGMTALGLLLLVAFKPANTIILQAPKGTIAEDVEKIMPALEPDLEGFTDPGISSAQLDETTIGQ